MSLKCGTKPGKGHYQSVETGEIITLDQDTDRLPRVLSTRKVATGIKLIKPFFIHAYVNSIIGQYVVFLIVISIKFSSSSPF